MDMNAYYITLICVGVLTWLVFVLSMAKISKFYLQFLTFKRDMDTNLTGIGANLKKYQNSFSELTIEQRRTNKLLVELIDIQKVGEVQIEYHEPELVSQQQPEFVSQQQPDL